MSCNNPIPCTSDLPTGCEPLPVANFGIRSVVEDEAGCRKTLQTTANPSILSQNADDEVVMADGSVDSPLVLPALQQQAGGNIPQVIGQLANGTLIGVIKSAGATEPEFLIHDGTNWTLVQRSDIFGAGAGVLCRDTTTGTLGYKIGTSGQVPQLNAALDIVFAANNPLDYAYISGLTQKTPVSPTDLIVIGDTAGTTIKKADFASIQPAGTVIQTFNVATTAQTDIASAVPVDNTPPQYSETTIILAQAITPTAVGNKILIDVLVAGDNQGAVICLFDATSGSALAVSGMGGRGNTFGYAGTLKFSIDVLSVAARTYYIGIGIGAVTVYLNRGSTTATYGGLCATNMTVQEIKG